MPERPCPRTVTRADNNLAWAAFEQIRDYNSKNAHRALDSGQLWILKGFLESYGLVEDLRRIEKEEQDGSRQMPGGAQG